jgi:hypothetical protein
MMAKRIFLAGFAASLCLAAAPAFAEDINLRIGSGHPPGVVYAGLMQSYFQPELKKRVEERTDHTISFVEGYSGSIVKVTEVLEGVQDGIIDIGGMCFCFEPSNLPLHAFQVMLPFGTMDPVTSLKIAQDVIFQNCKLASYLLLNRILKLKALFKKHVFFFQSKPRKIEMKLFTTLKTQTIWFCMAMSKGCNRYCLTS